MRSIILSILLITFFISCNQDKAPKSDGELHVAIKRDPAKLHPIIYPSQRARLITEYIFTPVGDYHPETHELVPILLEKIPEPQFITEGPDTGKIKYEIDIIDDATWEDGKPITGADYVFTLKAIKHPETAAAGYRSYLTNLIDARVDANDANKVHITFDEYYMLSTAAVSTIHPLPKHIYDPSGTLDRLPLTVFHDKDQIEAEIKKDSTLSTFAKAFNSIKHTREVVSGAGPYKLVDWVSDQIIVIERKENYWGEGNDLPILKAGPKKIFFHIIPDELTVINQLKAGEIDLYSGASASVYNDFDTDPKYKDKFTVMAPEVMRSYFIMLNNDRPELSDKDARRALAHLVDVPEIIKLLEGDLATLATGPINTKKAAYNDQLDPIKFNIAKAKEILSSEGWADTNSDGTIDKVIDGSLTEFELDIHTTGSELSNKIALIFAQNAKQAGIKVNIIQKKFRLFRRENLANLDYDMFTSSVTQSLAIDDPYSKWHIENSAVGGTNQSAYQSEKASEIIDAIRDTKDEKRRIELYKRFQEVVYEDQPVIWLYHPRERIILSNEWNGTSTIKRPGYMANTFTLAK